MVSRKSGLPRSGFGVYGLQRQLKLACNDGGEDCNNRIFEYVYVFSKLKEYGNCSA